MGQYVTLGSFGTIILLNILAMIITVTFAPLSGRTASTCEGMPSFACNTPVEKLATSVQDANEFDIWGLVSLIPNTARALFGFLTLDYDVLKGGGEIAGGIGFILRVLCWVMLAGAILSLAAQVLGR